LGSGRTLPSGHRTNLRLFRPGLAAHGNAGPVGPGEPDDAVIGRLAGGAAALALAACLWQVRRKFAVVTVVGDSMWPTYSSGDRVLVRRVPLDELSNGQVVVIEKPSTDGRWTSLPGRGRRSPREWIIKRVVALPGDRWPGPTRSAQLGPSGRPAPGNMPVPAGSFVVQGDNPHGSYDSRIFGYCPADCLLGVVVRSMSPAVRASAEATARQ
jgi:signal peptidase I